MLALKLDYVNKGVPTAVSIPDDSNASISYVVLLKWKLTQGHIYRNVDFRCLIVALIWQESRNLQ